MLNETFQINQLELWSWPSQDKAIKSSKGEAPLSLKKKNPLSVCFCKCVCPVPATQHFLLWDGLLKNTQLIGKSQEHDIQRPL